VCDGFWTGRRFSRSAFARSERMHGKWQAALAWGTASIASARVLGSRRLHRQCGALQAAATATALGVESQQFELRSDIRNLAIIAHVDHGKTTLVDALMKQTSGNIDDATLHMDSNQIEQERGITILAKNAAISHSGIKINLVDTPGHSDFGGEVERILNLVDGCLLLVDAQEGPMAQTKFVLQKALELGCRIIVCINKVDKPDARPDWVLDKTFDLFVALGANDELCDFPVCYTSGIKGMASIKEPSKLKANLVPLLDLIVDECPRPLIVKEQPLQMLVTDLMYDEFVGRICIGRLRSGSLSVGQPIGVQNGVDGALRKATVTQLWEFANNRRSKIDCVEAGDICAFAGKGLDQTIIGDTIVNPDSPLPLPPLQVDAPTVMIEFSINSSPLAGQSKGSRKITGPVLNQRLKREVLNNIALRLEPSSSSDSFAVKARGMLQLGILVETMRREGLEFMLGAPEVIESLDAETGARLEPYAEATVDVPLEFQGVVMEEMQKKGAVQLGIGSGAMTGEIVCTFEIAVRGLIGMQSRLLARTRGTAVLHSRFLRWGEMRSSAKLREKGSIFSTCSGVVSSYGIASARSRGTFFVRPGDQVFRGMCVGIHNKERDLALNITKTKQKSNVRDSGVEAEKLPGLLEMTIDDFLGHMETNELLEITPDALRLCKKPSAIPKNDG